MHLACLRLVDVTGVCLRRWKATLHDADPFQTGLALTSQGIHERFHSDGPAGLPQT
jgi:hypothetical protein